jgi:hypothetical protein
VRVVVVPTATTRRPASSARLIAAAASRDLVGLGRDAVVLDRLGAHRGERAVADVQRDLRDLDTARANRASVSG